MSNFRSLIREIDSHLDRVQDWESNWDEHLLSMSSLENWNEEQEFKYLLSRELKLRRLGDELLMTLLIRLSEETKIESLFLQSICNVKENSSPETVL
jgi:hypothetical protein